MSFEAELAIQFLAEQDQARQLFRDLQRGITDFPKVIGRTWVSRNTVWHIATACRLRCKDAVFE